MTVDKIYVVTGETGDFSDHTQWNVAAYVDKEAAEQHARLAKEFIVKAKRPLSEVKSPYDSAMDTLYILPKYYVEEIEIVRHVDEYQDKHPVEQVTDDQY